MTVRGLPHCTGCGACISACSTQALSLATDDPAGRGRKAVAVDTNRCNLCDSCVSACPRQALIVAETNP